MQPISSILTTALTCLLALLAPIIGYAQTCRPAGIPVTTPTSQFTDHGDGTVTDTKAGLMWKRCSEGQAWNGSTCTGSAAGYTWQVALQRAQAVNGAGGFAEQEDWRVPNSKELASLVEEQCFGPAINVTVFPATPLAGYWSASPDNWGDGSIAWYVVFDDGYANWGSKYNGRHVRLVRGGQ